MGRYMLRLLPSGDIDIITDGDVLGAYERVYHKTFNKGDKIKKSLNRAYKEWKKLTKKEMLG